MVINTVENSIDFDKTEFDFGRVKKGNTISVTFLYNGTKKIKSAKESCLCLSYRKVKFLDRTEITIWWETAKAIKKNIPFKSFKRLVVFFEDGSFQNLNMIAEIYE